MICIHQGPWQVLKPTSKYNTGDVVPGPEYLEIVNVTQCPDYNYCWDVAGYTIGSYEKKFFAKSGDISELTEILEHESTKTLTNH